MDKLNLYKGKLSDPKKKKFLEKIIKHSQLLDSKCPNPKDDEALLDVSKKFQIYAGKRCCKDKIEFKSEDLIGLLCDKCYIEIPLNGLCDYCDL